MALEMKATSRWWYARLLVNGKLRRFPLMEMRGGKEERLEIKGKRPASMKHPEKGDAAFLESFHRAEVAHERLLGDELSKKSVEDLAQRIIEAKTGTRLDFVKVENIFDAWATIPRKEQPCPKYLAATKVSLRRFSDFMRKNHPQVEDLAAVRAEHIQKFLNAEAKRGLSARTVNVKLKLLKTIFAKLEPNADANRGFLKNAPLRHEHTVHREPFKDDEIGAILKAAEGDEVLRGPLVTALCTAMRKGDCCTLRWSSLDLGAGFIEVPTSKTGETAEIPVLPLLREVLQCVPKTKSEYVFPAAAELYKNDPNALDRRFRKLLARAGFVDSEIAKTREGKKENTRPSLPQLPSDELRRRGLAAIGVGKMGASKRKKMAAIFTAYVSEKGLPTIARELGVSKSTVSLHLNEIERMLGVAVLRRPVTPPVPAVIRGAMQAEANGGQRLQRGSIRGWHSFRVSFVTRALSGGMPEELVRRVTGHTAVDVVREHYFKPGRDEFRKAFEKAMPKLMLDGAQSRDELLRETITRMTPKTWKQDKARLLEILARDQP